MKRNNDLIRLLLWQRLCRSTKLVRVDPLLGTTTHRFTSVPMEHRPPYFRKVWEDMESFLQEHSTNNHGGSPPQPRKLRSCGGDRQQLPLEATAEVERKA